MTDGRKYHWVVSLVPSHEITSDIYWRRTVFMPWADSEDERKRFYKGLLEIPWLPPTIRRPVMAELGLSLRKQKRGYEEGRTAALRCLIKERKECLQKQGERPRGGIHEQAIADIAREQGMTVDALKKRLQRQK